MAAVAQPREADEKGPRTSPISDYATIGDCRSAALVSKGGSIDWLCLPSFSSPSVFAAILDPQVGGRFSMSPEAEFTCSRRYVGQTPVLETTFETATGSVRLTDAMIIGGSARNLEPRREIVRLVEGLQGPVVLDLRWQPRPDYARGRFKLRRRGHDWACTWGNELLLLRSDQELHGTGSDVTGRIEVRAGERLSFSLSHEKGEIAVRLPLGRDAIDRVERTAAWWQGWADGCSCTGPWRDAVLRSAVTLKLMTFALSGAVVAAPTTSLPEWIGGTRNWDYRYCWLRDAALTMRAFTGLGLRREADAFLRWLLHATALTRPRLRVVYDVYGRARLPEAELTHLEGYADSRPVRIGNGAYDQTQLDVYGGVIAAAADFVETGGTLQRDQLKLLAGFGRTVCEIWRNPDNGIWEMRDRKRHHSFSKLMCWVALDRLLALSGMQEMDIPAGRFEEERAAIAEAIDTRGFNENLSSYVGQFEGDRLDASLLLMPCLGYGDPADPRQRSTFERIDERLSVDGLMYRYEPASDGLSGPEGAFGICSFWAVENLARRGEVERAERRFEQILERANDLGLFAEEIDPETGAALGNFPQAFTHVGLINAALAIEREKGTSR